MAVTSFPEFLKQAMDSAGVNQAELARRSGLSTAQVSRLYNGQSSPGPDACDSIARALRLPVETVYRAAGLLPPEPLESQERSLLDSLFDRLSSRRKSDILRMAQMWAEEEEQEQRRRTQDPRKRGTGELKP